MRSRRFGGSPHDATDVVQSTGLKARRVRVDVEMIKAPAERGYLEPAVRPQVSGTVRGVLHPLWRDRETEALADIGNPDRRRDDRCSEICRIMHHYVRAELAGQFEQTCEARFGTDSTE